MICENLLTRESFMVDFCAINSCGKIEITNLQESKTPFCSTNTIVTPIKKFDSQFKLGSLEALKSNEIKIDELSELSF